MIMKRQRTVFWAVLLTVSLCAGCCGTKTQPASANATENAKCVRKTIYDFTLTTGKGGKLNLADYKGKVILIVNTATGCGFTPQYAPIEKMYRDYHARGLEILDIPCNQFGGQAPGTDDEIHKFCTMHFNTTFPQMKKSDVNGPNELPLYTWLKSKKGFQGFDEHRYKFRLEAMLPITSAPKTASEANRSVR